MNYHPKHTANSRTAGWIGAGVLAAVAIAAIIFITITLRTPMTKEEARAKAVTNPGTESFMILLPLRAVGITFRRRRSKHV